MRTTMMLTVHSKAIQRWSVINGQLGKYTDILAKWWRAGMGVLKYLSKDS